MIEGRSILAVVPARSGSKGIPNKNMALLGGMSLIARAGEVLAAVPWIDRRVISTDSPLYAAEAQAHGLDAPFLRPETLSNDSAGAFETIVHALDSCERADGRQYDLVIVAEPTSPLRRPIDIEATVNALLKGDADSAVTVSQIDTKCHPAKIFAVVDGLLQFYDPEGERITRRQQLRPLYARNGLCYCFRRHSLLNKKKLITEKTIAVVTERPVVNIDESLDLLWAEFLIERRLGL